MFNFVYRVPKLNVHIREDTNDHFNIIYLIIMNINFHMNLNKENDEMSKPLVLFKNTNNIKDDVSPTLRRRIRAYEDNEGKDKPAHSRSLIRAFAVR